MFRIILLILFTNIICIQEWYETGPIVDLNYSSFYNIVGKDKYVLVEFYTKWCPHCKQMKSEYDKLYELYKTKRNDIVITKIECSNNNKIVDDFGVYRFPFIVLFFPGSTKMQKVFNSQRTVGEFDSWLTINAPKKNLKQTIQKNLKDEQNKITENNKTKIDEYVKNEFHIIKDKLNKLEEIMKDNKNINFLLNKKNIKQEIKENNKNVFVIKINSFFVIFIALIVFIIKIGIYLPSIYITFKKNK